MDNKERAAARKAAILDAIGDKLPATHPLKMTEEQKAMKDINASQASVDVIDRIVTSTSTNVSDLQELTRNVRHLEAVIARPCVEGCTHDKAFIEDAILLGNQYLQASTQA